VRIAELRLWSLEAGTAEERFDRTLKRLAQQDDVAGMFAYLDRVYAAGGHVPRRRGEAPLVVVGP
jgi:hypothetical protein